MTISSAFSVNGALPTSAVAVAPGSLVTLRVLNTAGLNSIEWSVVGNDKRVRVNPVITPSGSPAGAVATFTMPADIGDELGQAYRIQCVGKSGGQRSRLSSITARTTYVTTFAIVGVLNRSGIVPLAYGEELDRDLTYGWTETINLSLSNVATPTWAAMYSSGSQSMVAVATAPGWNVVGTFSMPVSASSRLDLIGAVSDLALTLTARLYCVSPGFVGALSGSEVSLSSLTDVEAFSGFVSLAAGRLYQVQAQVVGGVGDNYFGFVRRLTPSN